MAEFFLEARSFFFILGGNRNFLDKSAATLLDRARATTVMAESEHSSPYTEPLKEIVLQIFESHAISHKAFKIIPEYRIGKNFFPWGVPMMLPTWLLSDIAEDLCVYTPRNGTLKENWTMPTRTKDEEYRVTSVFVKSKGSAETFPADLLLLEHAPHLAEESKGAHVFHFFEEKHADIFLFILWAGINARDAYN